MTLQLTLSCTNNHNPHPPHLTQTPILYYTSTREPEHRDQEFVWQIIYAYLSPRT